MTKHEEINQDNRTNVYYQDRTIYFFDEVNNATVCEAIRYIDLLEKRSKKPIEIILNSGGGSCYEGLALYDRIRFSKCDICIIATGITASMGFIIFLAGKYRYLMPNTILMSHQISSNPEGKLGDLKIEMEEIKRLEKQCNIIISERTGLSIKTIEKQHSKGDYYITPETALKDGIAHKILDREGKNNA